MVLAEFICPACRISVVWAHPSSTIKCPYCTRWLTAINIENPARIDTEADGGQMILF
jgi:hypothetical protein